MRTGIIYGYTNLESGKMYIGQTLHQERRWKQHRYCKNATGWHKDYQNNPDKYEYSVIEYEVPEDKLDELEIFWISFFDSYRNGYNLTPGGDGLPKGYKLSDETKQKMSERKKGEHHVDVSGENNPFYGKTHSLETRKKMREHHADVSGKKNPMYGKCGELSPTYGRHWYNNGEISKFCFECPEGFVPGLLKK